MTIRWERFAGRTDRFAIRLSLLSDPDGGVGASSEESASWGSIEMWVDHRNLCANIDQGEALSASHWYLLPIAEWLTANWNALLHEERLPLVDSADTGAVALASTRSAPALLDEEATVEWEEERFAWWSRHAIRTSRTGGLLPNVVFRRLRDYVEISWDDEGEAGAPPGFEFTASRGNFLLRPREVAQPLYEVLTALADVLGERGSAGRLVGLRHALDAITGGEQERARQIWLAGMSPESRTALDGGHEPSTRWRSVIDDLTRPGQEAALEAALNDERTSLVVDAPSQAAMMFSSVSPTLAEDDVRTLAAVLIDRFSGTGDTPALRALARDVVPDPHSAFWQQGYDLAEDLHDVLDDLDADDAVDVERVVSDLGIEIVERTFLDRDIRACSLVGPFHLATIVHNTAARTGTSARARRFTVAHELCHLLYDRDRAAKVAIASGPWAPRGIEQRANAFAAMFLMPPDLLRSHLASLVESGWTVDRLTSLAQSLQVSRSAAVHHLYNLTMMSESVRDDLLRRTAD